jgi:hypothetical protein
MAWFSPQQHNPENAFGGSSLPEGKYPVHIIASGTRAAQSNERNGLLFLTMMIDEGPNKGVSGNVTFNLFNENQQAREIAAKQLAAVCMVCGVMGDMDGKPEGVELWNRPFIIEMGKQSKNPEYNEVKGVWDMNGNPPKAGNPAPSGNQPNFGGGQQQQPNFGQAVQQQPAQTGGWQGTQLNPQQQPSFQGGQQPAGNQPQFGGQPTTAGAQSAPGWQQQPAAGDKPSWSR